METNEHIATIYIAGDSTASIKPQEVYPETGWGQKIGDFFNPQIHIKNHAKNGCSSKSFVQEGRLKKISETISKGDYLFIQFGHNDSKPEKERFTEPQGSYKDYLMQFIKTAQSKGAIPVLLSSIHRRQFDENGKIINTHSLYHRAIKETAEKANVIFLDVGKKSKELLETLGTEKSKALFMNFKSNIYKNYPQGLQDNTHLTPQGAKEISKCIVSEIRDKMPQLSKHLLNT